MPEILKSESIYYKDVNLIAKPGIVKSRSEIPKRLDLILVSPMAAICGPKFVKEALNLGLSVGLHRFCPVNEQVELFKNNYDFSSRIWAAVGLDDSQRILDLYTHGCRNFIIDTANGYLESVVKFTYDLYNSELNKNKILNLMVGNIHSNEGVRLYRGIPNIRLRVGISNGFGCNTALMTSVNRGQITEIEECYNSNDNAILCADGGISCPAYAALAFATGADAIMLGGYFSKAEEAANIQSGEYKFWGSASYKQLELSKVKRSHSEGKILNIDSNEVKPLKTLVNELWGGIASATSYCGFSSLEGMIGNGTMEIKHS